MFAWIKMASTFTKNEIQNALKASLEQSGALPQLRARVRAEVFHALHNDNNVPPPRLCPENLLINELIREYLEFNRYHNAASVLVEESGLTSLPLGREFLEMEFDISVQPTGKLPLLYSLVSMMKKELGVTKVVQVPSN